MAENLPDVPGFTKTNAYYVVAVLVLPDRALRQPATWQWLSQMPAGLRRAFLGRHDDRRTQFKHIPSLDEIRAWSDWDHDMQDLTVAPMIFQVIDVTMREATIVGY